MKNLTKLLILTAILTLTLTTTTIHANTPDNTPEGNPRFNATVIVNDVDGMTDDYEYTVPTGTVDVKSKESALMVNGEFVPYKGVMKNGTTFVPVRVISESFGKETKWNEATQQVTIEDIVLTINNATATEGAKSLKLSEAPYIENGVTYVPLRFIAENLDKEVGYIPKSYKNAILHNSIVWVEDKELMDNNSYKAEEIVKWIQPQMYVNKNFFEQEGNEANFTKESIESMKYLGQLGRYAVIDSARPVVVDMYTKSVYFYTAGHGHSGIHLVIKDGAYYIDELDITIKIPEEYKNKIYLGVINYDYETRGANGIGLYHKGSADKEEGYGLMATITKWSKDYSTHNNLILAGGSYDLFSTVNNNYMMRYTSDLQGYEADKKIIEDYFKTSEIIDNRELMREIVNPISTEKVPLDYPYKATNEFFFGTWKVDKFLGFGEAYNDDTEQPNGYDIIGKEIVIGYENLDTSSFEKYPQFQTDEGYWSYESNSFGFENGKGVDFGTNENSQIIEILASPGYRTKSQEIVFYVIDDERMVMRVGDRTWYELVKVKEAEPNVEERPGVTFYLDNNYVNYYDYGPSYDVNALDDWSKDKLLNTYKVKKLVGFTTTTTVDAEYPTGPNIVGKEVIMTEEVFSTMDFEGYTKYQKEYKNPVYNSTANFSSKKSLIENEGLKLPGFKMEDSVTQISLGNENVYSNESFKFYWLSEHTLYMVYPGGAVYELEPVK